MASFYYYDEKIDDLLIANKEPDEKVKKNFVFDDFIISLTSSGKIVALEIKNASKFFIESGKDPAILREAKEITLEIIPKKNFIGIFINLMVPQHRSIVGMRVPITHLPIEALAY